MVAKLTAELCLVELPVELREQRRGLGMAGRVEASFLAGRQHGEVFLFFFSSFLLFSFLFLAAWFLFS
jgi:hypothetical protein